MGRKKLDLVGQIFGKLTVVSFSHVDMPANRSHWNCACECGGFSVVAGNNLKKGTSQSCGCMQGNRTHGLRNHPMYGGWATMYQRCYNPNYRDYKNYGGRGISICNEWKDFAAFLRDMGERPDDHTLDRMDNDGNYSKDNCKWSTAVEQANNRRPRVDAE